MTDYQTDRTIAQLDPVGAIQNTDQLPIITNNGTKRMTATQFAAYIAQGVPNPPSLPPFALLRRTTNYIPTVNFVPMPWEAVAGSETSLWDVAQPTRLTVPAGASYVRLSSTITPITVAVANQYLIQIRINGIGHEGLGANYGRPTNVGAGDGAYFLQSSIVSVIPGDYFEIYWAVSNPACFQINASQSTWFQMEVLA